MNNICIIALQALNVKHLGLFIVAYLTLVPHKYIRGPQVLLVSNFMVFLLLYFATFDTQLVIE